MWRGGVWLDALKEVAAARFANAAEMEHTIEGYCWDATDVSGYRIAAMPQSRLHELLPWEWKRLNLQAAAQAA